MFSGYFIWNILISYAYYLLLVPKSFKPVSQLSKVVEPLESDLDLWKRSYIENTSESFILVEAAVIHSTIKVNWPFKGKYVLLITLQN